MSTKVLECFKNFSVGKNEIGVVQYVHLLPHSEKVELSQLEKNYFHRNGEAMDDRIKKLDTVKLVLRKEHV